MIRQTSTAANKKCRQWDVHRVLPIDGIFAERCICSLLIKIYFVVIREAILDLSIIGSNGKYVSMSHSSQFHVEAKPGHF